MAWNFGKSSKYHAVRVTCDGQRFDSRKEARRYAELQMLEQAGEISDLQRQVKFVLIPAQRDPETNRVIERECAYLADFTYRENGKYVVEDVKGVRTDVYIIKRKLMLHRYGIRIREV